MFPNDGMSSIHREIKEIWNMLDRLKSFDVPSQENLDDRPINLNEFFSAVASDIGGIYYVMTETEAAAGTVVSASITSATTTNCFNFATVVGSPHLTRLVSGFYDVHAHLLKTGNRNVTAYCELYKRTSGGTETLLGTSPLTANLTTVNTFYDVYIHLGTEVTLVTTDRLVLKWYMVTTGAPAGSGTTMTLVVGGVSDSHLSVEIQTQELNNIFVLISEYITGWITETAAWTYASATTLTITGDVTARFPVGTKIKLTQTTVKYFYVVSAAYGAPNTTLTLTGGSDYSLANAAITSPYYSYASTPQGFPNNFSWTVTPVNLTTTGSPDYTGKFSMTGRRVLLDWVFNGGTTASTIGSTYITAPIAPARGAAMSVSIYGLALGACLMDASNGRIYLPSWTANANEVDGSGQYVI